MILSIHDLQNITKGAEDIIQSEKGIEFVRFNKEEQKLYLSSELEPRTHTPAGIQLMFRTDAKNITLEIETEKCMDRSFFCMDILKNGELAGTIKNFSEEKMVGFYSWSTYPQGKFCETIVLGDDEKDITIVLPWSVRCYFKRIELKGGSYIEPVTLAKNIILYGDSITHGYDCVHPSNAYSVRLAKALGAHCYIKAVGGEIFWPKLAGIRHSYEPDYVTVAYGANDWSKCTKEEFDKNAENFLKAIVDNYKTSKIIVIAPIWRKDHIQEGLGFGDMRYIFQKLSGECRKYDNVICVDGWELVPHTDQLFGDLRLHPNDRGFDYYVNNLMVFLGKRRRQRLS